MSQSIKICHLTSAHPDGDVRIFHKQCVSLAEAGYETYLIVPNSKTRKEKGVNIISFESNYKSRKERMTKTVKQVLEHAIQVDADIYHFHDPELLKIVKSLQKLGKKVIYDVHEDLPRQILSKVWIVKPLRKVIAFFTEKYENKIAKKCNAVITATPFIMDRFLKVNPNTIDINNFPILGELLINFDYKEKQADNICYVGGITATRGIKELVSCLNQTNTKLFLAGKFLEENLRNDVIKMNGWEKVDELGFLNREEVKELYKKSKLGIVTLHPIINYIDSLPVKMFEYMAAGLPVISSNFPLWKSIVEINNCGICVDPMNPNAIAKAINYIIENPIEAEQMGENGKKLVLEKYNWDIEKNKLINFYSKLIKD